MKILVLRIGRLGDIVMTLPAIHAIQSLYPSASLFAITSLDGLRVYRHIGIPHDRIITFRNQLLYRFQDAAKVKSWLAKHHFDAIYCFEGKKRTLSWLPQTVKAVTPQDVIQHYATRCLKLVTEDRHYWGQTGYFPRAETSHPELLNALKHHNITENTCLIGLHPTYSGFGKWGKKRETQHRVWPWQRFAELAISLDHYAKTHQLDIKLIMDLLPEEHELGKRIQEASNNRIILLTSKPNFSRYLAYLQRLNLLVVGNTGVMHLAAALNTSTLALFSELDPADCGPFMPEDRNLVLQSEDFTESHLGLAAIPVDAVYKKSLSLLRTTGQLPEGL